MLDFAIFAVRSSIIYPHVTPEIRRVIIAKSCFHGKTDQKVYDLQWISGGRKEKLLCNVNASSEV